MSDKYCVRCDKHPVQKGFRYCCVCKVQVEKEMLEKNYLTKTMFPKIHRTRSSKEGPDE